MINYSKLKFFWSYLLKQKSKSHLNYRDLLDISKYRKLSRAISPASEVSECSSLGSGIFFHIPNCMQNFSKICDMLSIRCLTWHGMTPRLLVSISTSFPSLRFEVQDIPALDPKWFKYCVKDIPHFYPFLYPTHLWDRL